jgi:hypothetical protein
MGSEKEKKDVSGLTSRSNAFLDIAKFGIAAVVISVLFYFGFVFLMLMLGR